MAWESIPVKERLLARLDKPDGDSGCWIWLGTRDWKGYGHLRLNGTVKSPGKMAVAHRVSYELFVGPIPEGLHLDHLCRVTSCVNPAHLEPVTNAENMRRRYALQTHCKWGHEFTPENIIWSRVTQRHCRECQRIRNREKSIKRSVMRAASRAHKECGETE